MVLVLGGESPVFFLGHSHVILNISSESSAQAKSIATLVEQIGSRGEVCGHVQKSEAHALGCRLRGESSQRSSNLPQTYRIVPA